MQSQTSLTKAKINGYKGNFIALNKRSIILVLDYSHHEPTIS